MLDNYAGSRLSGSLVISSAERSSMVNMWMEHLCLTRLGENQWIIDVRCFQMICEAGEFFDEELEDFILPEKIEGHAVLGIENDYVMIKNLVSSHNVHEIYEFSRFSWEEYIKIFSDKAPFFCDLSLREAIQAGILGDTERVREIAIGDPYPHLTGVSLNVRQTAPDGSSMFGGIDSSYLQQRLSGPDLALAASHHEKFTHLRESDVVDIFL